MIVALSIAIPLVIALVFIIHRLHQRDRRAIRQESAAQLTEDQHTAVADAISDARRRMEPRDEEMRRLDLQIEAARFTRPAQFDEQRRRVAREAEIQAQIRNTHTIADQVEVEEAVADEIQARSTVNMVGTFDTVGAIDTVGAQISDDTRQHNTIGDEVSPGTRITNALSAFSRRPTERQEPEPPIHSNKRRIRRRRE